MMRHLIIIALTLVALTNGFEHNYFAKQALHLIQQTPHKPIVDVLGTKNIGYFVAIPKGFEKLMAGIRKELQAEEVFLPLPEYGYLVVIDQNYKPVGFYTESLYNQECKKNPDYYFELLGQTELSPRVDEDNKVSSLIIAKPGGSDPNYVKLLLKNLC